MRWIEVEVRAAAAAHEPVAAALLASGSQGVSITSSGEEIPASVRGYFRNDPALAETLADLRRRLQILCDHDVPVEAEPAARDIDEADWANAWKAFYKPLEIGRYFVVKPTWERYAAAPGRCVIELDPGMAFGTGAHPTTQLCLELLEERVKPKDRVLDWGTGSGILAIASALLGAGHVCALDLDLIAVEAARQNAALNGVADRVDVRHSDLAGSRPFDGVVANILPDPIIHAARQLRSLTSDAGWLIAGGIVTLRAPEVETALARAGFRTAGRREQGEWVALVFDSKS
jgi:ribosomal protein L11 methyltransferase